MKLVELLVWHLMIELIEPDERSFPADGYDTGKRKLTISPASNH